MGPQAPRPNPFGTSGGNSLNTGTGLTGAVELPGGNPSVSIPVICPGPSNLPATMSFPDLPKCNEPRMSSETGASVKKTAAAAVNGSALDQALIRKSSLLLQLHGTMLCPILSSEMMNESRAVEDKRTDADGRAHKPDQQILATPGGRKRSTDVYHARFPEGKRRRKACHSGNCVLSTASVIAESEGHVHSLHVLSGTKYHHDSLHALIFADHVDFTVFQAAQKMKPKKKSSAESEVDAEQSPMITQANRSI
ncbi:hypothetical protein B0H13DRAFT_1850839 [Mycena leptocephala]|nr:hypothetical protein B0H13DRAFT_1850839 [Mycena leptocephala]